MSDRSAKSAPASGVKQYWKHVVVTSDMSFEDAQACVPQETYFADLIDDYCAEGYEVVTYSVAVSGDGLPLHSALMRRRADGDEHHAIETRRTQRFEEGIAQDPRIPR